MNIQEFIENKHINIKVKPRLFNPNIDSEDMDHWTVYLNVGGRRMNFAYSMGSGHNGKEPDLEGVLECLASDVSCSQGTFKEFCSDLGYNEDSRKAEKIYLACRRIKQGLVRLVGLSGIDELLEVEF